MAPHQLHWAWIQALEEDGKPREHHREAAAQQDLDAGIRLIAWADQHISRR